MAKFDDYGVRKGLAYKHNWDAATDRMLQFEQFKQQQALKREKKIQYYTDKIQRGNPTTQYNTQRLQKYYDSLNQELGKFLVDNPDWEQDMMKVNEFNTLTDKYLNNPIMKEELQAQKDLEMIRQDRHNMGDEHFMNLMDIYEKYSKQEVGDDPLSESLIKFGYVPEVQLDIAATTARFQNFVGMKQTEVIGADGKTTKTVLKPDEEKVTTAYSMILTDDKAMRTYNNAWRNYKGNDFDSLEDFIKSALRSSKNIKEAIGTIGRSGSGSDDGSMLLPYSYNLLQGLIRSANESKDGIGRYNAGEEGVIFTDYGEVGALVNPKDEGVKFASYKDENGNIVPATPLSNYQFGNKIRAMRIVNGGEIRYSPENGGYVEDVYVVMDMPNADNKNDNNVVEDLKRRGFTEVDNYYSYFGEDVAKLQTGPKKRGMYGKITVPADPTNPSRYNKYEFAVGGRSLKWQQNVQNYQEPTINAFESYGEQVQSTWDKNQEIIKQKNKFKEDQMNPAAQIAKNTGEVGGGDLNKL